MQADDEEKEKSEAAKSETSENDAQVVTTSTDKVVEKQPSKGADETENSAASTVDSGISTCQSVVDKQSIAATDGSVTEDSVESVEKSADKIPEQEANIEVNQLSKKETKSPAVEKAKPGMSL